MVADRQGRQHQGAVKRGTREKAHRHAGAGRGCGDRCASADANPANNLKEFIAWLKANPDKASAGTVGVGSPQHIFGLQLQKATGARFQFVHYRGGAPATQDLVAGNIDLVIADQVTSLPQIKAGTIKGLAYTGATRLPTAPDVPTVAEAGLPDFTTSVWNAVWAPKGTPKDVVARLMRRSSRPCPIRLRANGSLLSARSSCRASSIPPRRRGRCTRPKSRSGGRSSRRPASCSSRAASEPYIGWPDRAWEAAEPTVCGGLLA